MPLHLPPFSRREFLRRALIGGTSLALAPRVFAAAVTKADPHAWALLSDTHIPAVRSQVARDVKPCDRLADVVAEVIAWDTKPAGVLVNGDLALGTGEAADYATFSDLIAPLRGAGLPLHLTLGNHDNRERFWAGLTKEKACRHRSPIGRCQWCGPSGPTGSSSIRWTRPTRRPAFSVPNKCSGSRGPWMRTRIGRLS
jgi:3',5'-cyclic AMP phosphodiesterase CpdA